MLWRNAAKAVDAGNDNVVTLGRPTIENRIQNVKAAQARVIRARAELETSVYDLNMRSQELAAALTEIDAGVTVTAQTITAQDTLAAE